MLRAGCRWCSPAGTCLTPRSTWWWATATEHLLAHGHTRIAYVGGPQTIAQFQDRLGGWRAALEAAAIAPLPELCLSLDRMDIESGRQAAHSLFSLAEPPTAVFAATDNLAFGVLKSCAEVGCAVPERLALIGFDTVPFGEVALVPLTSVDGSGLTIGQRAMGLLIDRIEGGAKARVRADTVRMVIEPRLCIRRSCGCRARKDLR